MIKINLLPGSDQRKGSGPSAPPAGLGFKLFALILLAALGGAGYYGYMTYEKEQASHASVKKAADKVKKAKDTIKSLKAEFEELAELSDRIEVQFAIVQALANPESRLFWSEKVNMLAALRTQLAIYVTKLELQEEIEERETPESVARRNEWSKNKAANKGPAPKAIKVPVIKQKLIISAIAYGTDSPQRLRQIRGFMDELRTFKWKRKRTGKEVAFIDNLDPSFTVGNQKTDQVANVEVSRFSITIRAIEQTVDTAKNTPPAPAAPGTTPPAAASAQKKG